MSRPRPVLIAASILLAAGVAAAQQMGVPTPTPKSPQQQQQQPQVPAPLPPQTAAALAGPAGNSGVIPLSLQGASLTQVVDLLAQNLKINYLIDPKVKGNVILNSYGEAKEMDFKSLLETILRINGAGMVKVGNLWRIVPLNEMPHQ